MELSSGTATSKDLEASDDYYELHKRDFKQVTNESDQFEEDYTELKGTETLEETKLSWFSRFAAITAQAETKGIEPITDEEKNDPSLINAASMWFSANMVIASYALGCLGPIAFGVNFGASVLVIFFFNIIGGVSVAFFSVFGAEFGLRQMVLSRFLLGNITARIFCIINIVACIGWGAVNTLVSAQLLNTINEPHQIPLWAATLVIVGGTFAISFFGYKVIHAYEKWSWVPNFAVFLVIIAQLAKSGNFTNGSWGGGPVTAAGVLTFGSTIYGFAAGWTTYAADYTVYMPRNTNKLKIFFSLLVGLLTPLIFTMVLGAAAGAAAVNNKEWLDYYETNRAGGLTYAILAVDSLGGFGEFCCVLLALSTIANNIPNMYTIALSVQALWDPLARVPRVIWTILGNLFVYGLATAAVYCFSGFMESFMNSIGYYLSIYVGISCCEHFVFRRGFKGYNIQDWNNTSKLPVGYAGTTALVVGAFGVALGMSQSYWVGEIGGLIGGGADIGFELGLSWSFITYLILRPLEIKYVGR